LFNYQYFVNAILSTRIRLTATCDCQSGCYRDGLIDSYLGI